MQRVGHHAVRGAVVTVLSALLLVLAGPLAGAQAHAPARTSGPGSTGVHRATNADPGPAVTPQTRRAGHVQRLDGSAAAMVGDRAAPGRPSYASVMVPARTDPVRAALRAGVQGRAPPA